MTYNLLSAVLLFFNPYIELRLFRRLLVPRRGIAVLYPALLVWSQIESYININMGLYLRFPQELFFMANLFLFLALFFEGTCAKKILIVILVHGLHHTVGFIFLPVAVRLCSQLPVEYATNLFKISDVLASLIIALIYELIIWKFCSIQGAMTTGCILYLLLLSLFLMISVIYFCESSMARISESSKAMTAASIYAAFGAGFIILSIYYTDRRLALALMEQQSAISEKHLLALKERENQTASFRHDLKNHLNCLKSLLDQSHFEEARVYMNGLSASKALSAPSFSTGNLYADAILSEKWSLARAHRIFVSSDLIFPPILPFSPLDLCTILGNALDNAIEACLLVESSEKRYIKISAFTRRAYLILEIENPDVKGPKRLFHLEENRRHGIGLMNVEQAVRRCNGNLQCSRDNGVYRFCVMLPIDACQAFHI